MERIVVLDFGGQYNQLIARRVREAGVYSELLPHNAPIEQIKGESLSGLILTGGPDSVYAEGAKACDDAIFSLGVPVHLLRHAVHRKGVRRPHRSRPCA